MSDPGDNYQLRYGPPPPTAPNVDASSPTAQQPSPPPHDPGPDAPVPSTRHTSGMPAAAWPLVVLFGAAIASVLGGAVVAFVSFSGSGDRDDWSELGAILVGLLAGAVVFAVSYVVGLVLAARRAFPHGRRGLPIALALGIPVGLVALVVGLGSVADLLHADLAPAVGVVAGLAVLAAGPVAFAWAGTTAGRRRLLVAVAAAAALVVGVAGVGMGVERARTSRIVAQLPLVLFEGRTAEAPFAGWRRDAFSSVWITENRRTFTELGHSAYLKYLSRGGAIFVTMYTEVGPCADTIDYVCRVEGAVNGGEQRTYTRVARYGSYPRSEHFAVLVYADGSGVSVNALAPGQSFLTTPDEVLRSLIRVDRETFERATGSALQVR
jgi:hypothetical protein